MSSRLLDLSGRTSGRVNYSRLASSDTCSFSSDETPPRALESFGQLEKETTAGPTSALMAPPAPQTSFPSTTAASRVFDTAELLEMILVYVSHNAHSRLKPVRREQNGTIGRPKPRKSQYPAERLFPLQRVNSTFQATILRNKTIQRQMFLAPYPSDEDGILNPYSVLELFKKRMESKIPEDIVRRGRGQAVFQSGLFITHRLMNGIEAAFPQSEASWRKIKIHCIKDSAPLRVMLTGQNHPVWSFRYEEGITLGQLHDALVRVMPLRQEYLFRPAAVPWSKIPCPISPWKAMEDSRSAYERLCEECSRSDLWE